MTNSRILIAGAVVAGIALLVVAGIYLFEPIKSLPSFFPGAGSEPGHHTKHGIAAFVVAVGCFVFAWFRTGPKQTASAA